MWAVFLILLGATITSFGMVLQKKGIQWLDLRKTKQKYMGYFWMWVIGLLLAYVISAIPNGIASQTLPPHIVTSAAGWNIVMIVILSKFFLKEQVFRSDIFYTVIVMGMTILIAFRSQPVEHFKSDLCLMIILFVIPGVSLLPLFFKRLDNKKKSILLSVFAGCMGGLTMVFFNMAIRELFSWNIKNIPVVVLILYILAAILGAASEQASYRIGEMKAVAVVRLSFYIIYPVLGSILLFNIKADIIQLLAIAVLILSCYGIFKKR